MKKETSSNPIANRHSLVASWKKASRWMLFTGVLYAFFCIPFNIYASSDPESGLWLSFKMGLVGMSVVVLTIVFNGLVVKFPLLAASLMLTAYGVKLVTVLLGLLLIQESGQDNLQILALELVVGILLIAVAESWAIKRSNVLTIQ